MSSSDQTETPQPELTPEAMQIIGKARRSFGVSMLILMCGFIAIAGALVYRVTRDGGGPAAQYSLSEISMPLGSELISVFPNDGVISVTYRVAGSEFVMLLDGKTGEELRTIAVTRN